MNVEERESQGAISVSRYTHLHGSKSTRSSMIVTFGDPKKEEILILIPNPIWRLPDISKAKGEPLKPEGPGTAKDSSQNTHDRSYGRRAQLDHLFSRMLQTLASPGSGR